MLNTTDEMSNELYYSQLGVEDIEPKFKVGDVVNITNGSRLYVIKEAIVTSNRLTDRIIYEVAPFDDEDQLYQFEESVLEFQYHDDYWDFYFNEAVRNGLPAWRGELYNVYEYYDNPDKLSDIGLSKDASEHEKDTLPPRMMAHIIERHSIYSRIDVVLANTGNHRMEENRDKIKSALMIDDARLNEIIRSIRTKILTINENDTDSEYKKHIKRKVIPEFTGDELRVVGYVDLLDFNGDIPVDHYPVKMTNLQIMDAIREAYNNTEKCGKRKIQKNKGNDGSLPAPTNGKKVYLGKSRKYSLTIEFWYNFDLDFIESAYPIRENKWFQEI